MASELEREEGGATFVLKPNPAPSWWQIKVFFAIVGGTSLTVACAFAVMGMWPVLPFAGMEEMLLGWALYHTARKAELQEVVQVHQDVIEIARGRKEAERCWRLRSAWARVQLERPRSRHHPSRLMILAEGERVEIGSFLLEDERQALARELREAVSAVALIRPA